MRREEKFFPKLLTKAENGLGITGALAIAAMMVITTIDVIMRKVLGSPIRGSYEIVTLLFVPVVFLAIAYVQRDNGHISIGVLFDRLPQKMQRPIEAILLILALVIFALFTWQSAYYALWAYRMGDTIVGAMPILTWPSRLAIPIGTGLLFLRLLAQIIQMIRGGVLEKASGQKE